MGNMRITKLLHKDTLISTSIFSERCRSSFITVTDTPSSGNDANDLQRRRSKYRLVVSHWPLREDRASNPEPEPDPEQKDEKEEER